MQETTEFSFVLKSSNIAGVGVFALHNIASNVKLDIWPNAKSRLLHESEIPEELRGYCVAKENDVWACPEKFNKMELGWHLNHSSKPNVIKKGNDFYSLIPINKNDELLLDYNSLGEPEDKKEKFYRASS